CKRADENVSLFMSSNTLSSLCNAMDMPPIMTCALAVQFAAHVFTCCQYRAFINCTHSYISLDSGIKRTRLERLHESITVLIESRSFIEGMCSNPLRLNSAGKIQTIRTFLLRPLLHESQQLSAYASAL